VVAPSHAQLDLLDAEAVRRWVGERRPERVFHLAALASVGRSWDEPERTLAANTAMTLHVLEAVRSEAPAARVLIAGSGEVYGPPERLPVDEEHPLRPQSPYAVSKATGDLLAGQYADAHGLHVVRWRAFNHAGPGQGTDYLVGTLTAQVAQAERAGAQEIVVRTGNPDARRDFTDVRDVARAHALLVDQAAGAYNTSAAARRSPCASWSSSCAPTRVFGSATRSTPPAYVPRTSPRSPARRSGCSGPRAGSQRSLSPPRSATPWPRGGGV